MTRTGDEAFLVMADVPGITEALSAIGQPHILPRIENLDHFLENEGRNVRVLVQLGRKIADDALLDALPALRLVAVVGAGYEGLDVSALARRGVTLTTGRGVNANDVADVAIGLTLSLTRRLADGDRLVRAGDWQGLPAFTEPARSMSDMRFGIVGLGAIGTAIAHRLAPFGGSLRWWGPRPKPSARIERASSLRRLAAESDVLLLAAPADPGTRGLIDTSILDALGPRGYLVNISRGQLVDQNALYMALRDRTIAGAGLDVFENEPFCDPAWAALDNVIMTPHLAGWATAGMRNTEDLLIGNIQAFIEGRALLTPVLSEPPSV